MRARIGTSIQSHFSVALNELTVSFTEKRLWEYATSGWMATTWVIGHSAKAPTKRPAWLPALMPGASTPASRADEMFAPATMPPVGPSAAMADVTESARTHSPTA